MILLGPPFVHFFKSLWWSKWKKNLHISLSMYLFFVHVDTIIQIIASSLFYKEKRKRRVQKRFKQLVYQLKKKRESDLSYLSLFLFQSQRDQFHIPHKLTPFSLSHRRWMHYHVFIATTALVTNERIMSMKHCFYL
jgi:hypothetical protein